MAGPQPGEKVLTACDSEGTSVDEESGMRRCCQKIAGLCTLTTSFQSAHRRFCVRLSLACSVALWVAVLGIPLYFRTPYYAIFGSRGDAVFHHTQQFHHQEVACEADMVGRMQNIGNHTHRQYVPWTGETPWPKHEKIWSDYIWCGLLPAVWQDYWPNIAQFIVFTAALARLEEVAYFSFFYSPHLDVIFVRILTDTRSMPVLVTPSDWLGKVS